MTTTIWRAVTHQGLMHSQNDDAHWVGHFVEEKDSISRYLFAVADGLGGYHGGSIASRLALKSVKEEFYNWHGGETDRLVSQSIKRANQKVFRMTQSEPGLFNKMQTTLTVVALEKDSLTIGHVGDCRLYRTRHGHIKLLTRDHTMVNDMLRLHLISQEQANQHQGRYQLTRSIGSEPFLDVDIIREQIMTDDTYLLCSDGLWSELSQEDINLAMQDGNIIKACEKLVNLALKTGAPDNITAIIFRIDTIGKYTKPNILNRFLGFKKFIIGRVNGDSE